MRNTLLILLGFLLSYASFGQCSFEKETRIQDNRTTYFRLLLSGDQVVDLSDPNKQLCGVKLNFSHDVIGDLDIVLISPSGQKVTLIKSSGTRSTEGDSWDVTFLRCGEKANPDPLKKPKWDSDQDWKTNTTFNGSYLPVGSECLGNINRGDARGVWTLSIRDMNELGLGSFNSFELVFCENSSLQCFACDLTRSLIASTTVNACGGDPSLQNLLPTLLVNPGGDYVIRYVAYRKNGDIISISDNVDLTNEPKGTYFIRAVAIKREQLPSLIFGKFSQLNSAFHGTRAFLCGAISNRVTRVNILNTKNENEIVQDTICSGDSLVLKDQIVKTAGTYVERFVSKLGCDSIVEHRVVVYKFEGSVLQNAPLSCTNKIIKLSIQSNSQNYDDISWDTDVGKIEGPSKGKRIVDVSFPGNYTVTVAKRGCMDRKTITVNPDSSLPLVSLPKNDTIKCSDANGIILRPNLVNVTNVRWEGPQQFVSTSRTPTINKLGAYKVTVSNSNCSVTKSIFIYDLRSAAENISLRAEELTCSDGGAKIEVIGGQPGYTYRWLDNAGNEISREESPTIVGEGNYRVAIGISAECTVEKSIELVAVYPSPTFEIQGDSVLNCSNTKVELEGRGNNLVEFYWTTPDNQRVDRKQIVANEIGIYSFAARDERCWGTKEIEIKKFDSVPTVTVENKEIPCNATETLIEAVGSPSTVSYNWRGPNGFKGSGQSTNVGSPGTYTVVVTDPVSLCRASAEIEVTTAAGTPELTIERTGVLNCNNAQAEIEVSSTCSGCTINWLDVDPVQVNNNVLTISQGGKYSVEIVDPTSGCSRKDDIFVQSDTLPPNLGLDYSPYIGCDNKPVAVSVDTSRLSSFSLVGKTNATKYSSLPISLMSPDRYYISYAGKNGCIGNDSIDVVISNQVSDFRLAANDIDCRSDSVLIRLQNNSNLEITSVQWRDTQNNVSSSPFIYAKQPGIYKALVTNEIGCTNEDSIRVNIDRDKPRFDLTENLTISCSNLSGIELSITSSEVIRRYKWTSDEHNFSSGKENPVVTQPGNYSLEVTGANYCISDTSFQVLEADDKPRITIPSDTLTCARSTLELDILRFSDASTSDISKVSWNTPVLGIQEGRQIMVSDSGRYSVLMELNNGCLGTANFTLVSDQMIPFINNLSSDTISCKRESLSVSATLLNSLQGASIGWITPEEERLDGASQELNIPGEYKIVSVSLNGCSDTTFFNLLADTLSPIAYVPDDTLSCSKTRVTLNPQFEGAKIDSLVWVGPDNFMSNKKSPRVTIPGNYILEVFGPNGCNTIVQNTVKEDIVTPDLSVEDLSFPCHNDSIALSFQTNALVVEDSWFGPDDFYSEQASPKVRTPGDYVVVIKGANGCISTDTLVFSPDKVYPEFNGYEIVPVDCEVTLGQISLSALDYPDFELKWLYPDGRQVSDSLRITKLDTGMYRAVLTKNPDRCKDTLDIRLNSLVNNVQGEIVPLDSVICDSRDVKLTYREANNLPNLVAYWSSLNSRILVSNPSDTAIAIDTGLYVLRLRDTISKCEHVSEIQMNEIFNSLGNIDLRINDVSCDGGVLGSIVIDSVENQIGGIQSSLIEGFYFPTTRFDALDQGTYKLYVSDAKGCKTDTIVEIGQVPSFVPSLGNDTIVLVGYDYHLKILSVSPDSTEVVDRWWVIDGDTLDCITPGCLQEKIKPLNKTEVVVYALDKNGCIASDSLLVRVRKEYNLFVPNTFTPNGDGQNDELEISFDYSVKNIELFEIYDRWGNKIYEQRDVDPLKFKLLWDGNYGNKPAQPGVFVYVARYETVDGQKIIQNGDITLLR